MSQFAKCMLIVTAEIDADVEDEWNAWYDAVHFPDVLAQPGVHGGQRYVTEGIGRITDKGEIRPVPSKIYTTVYQIDGPEVMETPAFKAMRGWHHFAARIRATTRVIRAL
ncbi:MAG: hypothetical protein O3B74_10875 [Proteobacteria bacterium]|nr:hypothetical protein [Pseudomonadota bacterium]MDA1308506.1 hypothetical protein [Pseudomonadota bacterium]